MHTVRAAELLRWHRSGGYDAILARQLPAPRRERRPVRSREDYADAAGYYGEKTRETVETFKDGHQQRARRRQLGVAQSMKVLLVGGGGREHALAWRLRQEDPSLELIAAPGNPGIAELAECVPIGATDIDALLAFARSASRRPGRSSAPKRRSPPASSTRFRAAGCRSSGRRAPRR